MIRRPRNTRTDLDMIESGAWAKIGRKAFRHMDGAIIKYNNNRWVWEIENCGAESGRAYGTLQVARYYAERELAKISK